MNAPARANLLEPGKLWSLWDMLQGYVKVYELALELGSLREKTSFFASDDYLNTELGGTELMRFRALLSAMPSTCTEFGLEHSAEMAKRAGVRPNPKSNRDMQTALASLHDSLSYELEREAVFRVPPERKRYYDQDHLFGIEVSAAFPSCERDIRQAGNCFALGQEDACVHHLMLVLERGLTALGAKVGVTFHYADWKKLIDQIEVKLNSGTLPRGPELDFYRAANSQFGFLKEAYRKHSAHARDDPYDLSKALSILNHVEEFMRVLEKGGLKE